MTEFEEVDMFDVEHEQTQLDGSESDAGGCIVPAALAVLLRHYFAAMPVGILPNMLGSVSMVLAAFVGRFLAPM